MVSASGPIASTRASRKYGLGLRQTHLVRPCEVRVVRGQYADGDPPRGRRLRLLQHQLDVIQELVSVAVGAPDVAQAERLGQRRRHSGEPAHRRPCRRSRRGCRSTRHDRQAREPPSPAGGNPRTPGPPGHTDAAARTPSRVRQMARLMSITRRPPNGARRFASSKGSFAP
jgi:hypothetical protein